MNKKNIKDQYTDYKDAVLKEYEKGNAVLFVMDEVMTIPLKQLVAQHIDGLLWDLNRGEEVVLCFIKDPKWVNDFAVAKVIRELKRQTEELKDDLKRIKIYINDHNTDEGTDKFVDEILTKYI